MRGSSISRNPSDAGLSSDCRPMIARKPGGPGQAEAPAPPPACSVSPLCPPLCCFALLLLLLRFAASLPTSSGSRPTERVEEWLGDTIFSFVRAGWLVRQGDVSTAGRTAPRGSGLDIVGAPPQPVCPGLPCRTLCFTRDPRARSGSLTTFARWMSFRTRDIQRFGSATPDQGQPGRGIRSAVSTGRGHVPPTHVPESPDEHLRQPQ